MELHYRDRSRLDAALVLAARAIAVCDEPAAPSPLIVAEVR
jgi:hypothetical protein